MRFSRLLWPLSICHFLLSTSLLSAAPTSKDKSRTEQQTAVSGDAVEVTDPELADRINAAIRKGAAWLKKQQLPDGSFPEFDGKNLTAYGGGTENLYLQKKGLTALALLALLYCDVDPANPIIEKGFKWLRPEVQKSPVNTYDQAVTIMAVEAKYLAPARRRAKPGRAPRPPALSPDDWSLVQALARTLVANQHAGGGWRYGPGVGIPHDFAGGKVGFADVSATQYALLGLQSAIRCGFEAEPSLFLRAADFLISVQEKDGPRRGRVGLHEKQEKRSQEEASTRAIEDRARGWPYHPEAGKPHESAVSSAMTAAGVVGLLICRAELIENKALRKREREQAVERIEPAIFDGLAWLDANFTVEKNISRHPHALYHHSYYLYALERVGIMGDLSTIGPGNHWYEQGARYLVDRLLPAEEEKAKEKEGYWEFSRAHPPPRTYDTPHALLFLRKGTVKIGYSIGEVAGKRYEVGGE